MLHLLLRLPAALCCLLGAAGCRQPGRFLSCRPVFFARWCPSLYPLQDTRLSEPQKLALEAKIQGEVRLQGEGVWNRRKGDEQGSEEVYTSGHPAM